MSLKQEYFYHLLNKPGTISKLGYFTLIIETHLPVPLPVLVWRPAPSLTASEGAGLQTIPVPGQLFPDNYGFHMDMSI